MIMVWAPDCGRGRGGQQTGQAGPDHHHPHGEQVRACLLAQRRVTPCGVQGGRPPGLNRRGHRAGDRHQQAVHQSGVRLVREQRLDLHLALVARGEQLDRPRSKGTVNSSPANAERVGDQAGRADDRTRPTKARYGSRSAGRRAAYSSSSLLGQDRSRRAGRPAETKAASACDTRSSASSRPAAALALGDRLLGGGVLCGDALLDQHQDQFVLVGEVGVEGTPGEAGRLTDLLDAGADDPAFGEDRHWRRPAVGRGSALDAPSPAPASTPTT